MGMIVGITSQIQNEEENYVKDKHRCIHLKWQTRLH